MHNFTRSSFNQKILWVKWWDGSQVTINSLQRGEEEEYLLHQSYRSGLNQNKCRQIISKFFILLNFFVVALKKLFFLTISLFQIINTGIKMFARSDNKGADCGFRIAQEVCWGGKLVVINYKLIILFEGCFGIDGVYDQTASSRHEGRYVYVAFEWWYGHSPRNP